MPSFVMVTVPPTSIILSPSNKGPETSNLYIPV